jgi:hypothetical protein
MISNMKGSNCFDTRNQWSRKPIEWLACVWWVLTVKSHIPLLSQNTEANKEARTYFHWPCGNQLRMLKRLSNSKSSDNIQYYVVWICELGIHWTSVGQKKGVGGYKSGLHISINDAKYKKNVPGWIFSDKGVFTYWNNVVKVKLADSCRLQHYETLVHCRMQRGMLTAHPFVLSPEFSNQKCSVDKEFSLVEWELNGLTAKTRTANNTVKKLVTASCKNALTHCNKEIIKLWDKIHFCVKCCFVPSQGNKI